MEQISEKKKDEESQLLYSKEYKEAEFENSQINESQE